MSEAIREGSLYLRVLISSIANKKSEALKISVRGTPFCAVWRECRRSLKKVKLGMDSECKTSLIQFLIWQDLPNNMIHQVSIKSLPQEWLWCETWCDNSTKEKAKTIDLVNFSFYETSTNENLSSVYLNSLSSLNKLTWSTIFWFTV